jgi:hypothetical protein
MIIWVGMNVRDVNKKPTHATIAICTRNRTDDLRRCLSALVLLSEDEQEILVIDKLSLPMIAQTSCC